MTAAVDSWSRVTVKVALLPSLTWMPAAALSVSEDMAATMVTRMSSSSSMVPVFLWSFSSASRVTEDAAPPLLLPSLTTVTGVPRATVTVSSTSFRSSSAMEMERLAVVSPASTVTLRGAGVV